MKKFLIILIIAAVVCTSAFAVDVKMGVMQNFVNTSFIVDAEFDHFGIEGAVGVPAVYMVVGGIEAIIDAASPDAESSAIAREAESTETEESKKSGGFSFLGGAMVNVYWKAFAGEKFSFRLGLQGDFLGLFDTDSTPRYSFIYGPSLGFDFKFNEKFSMNFTSAIPAAIILSPFGDEVSKYGGKVQLDSNAEGAQVIGEIFLGIFGTIGNVLDEFARLSFKWSV